MKSLLLFLLFPLLIYSQYEYEVSEEHPYGKINPKAPKQLKDYQNLIGTCKCKSVARNPDGSWKKEENMIWRWKYIMNGMAVQDETLKENGVHSGSIRQYDKDSLRWNVHYYTTGSISSVLPVWNGNRNKEGEIILYKKQKAPNGMDGFYRLTFSNISKKGFNWVGEWVDVNEKFAYPTWKIICLKEE